MQLTISVSQFGGLLVVQISIFRPKNTRTKAYLSISFGGQNPRGGTLSVTNNIRGRQYLLADIVRGDSIC